MKHVMKIFSAAIVSTAFMGSAAGAVSCDGTISLTSPVSNNIISCNEVNNIAISCVNDVIVGSINTQTGTSGDGSATNNTNGGNVATGTVLNDNGQNIVIGASCESIAEATDTDTSGGSGAADTPGGGQGAATMPLELPNTSASNIMDPSIILALMIIIGASGVLITGATNRRRAIKK